MTRTFSRSDWLAAQQAWDDGEFSSEWREVRHKAAMGGIIFPPSGTRFDSWDDDQPSQRAMLIRAIRETPKLLDRCLIGARSWSEVIDRLMRARDEWREQMRLEEPPPEDVPDHRESAMALAAILRRIGDSA